ncbi:MAG: flagellar motor protein MotB [Pseudomonadota bacterium]
MAGKNDKRPIIIKKVKKVAGGHHGGAWKVAYADFTTAMMAFFMLLWLLNVSEKVTLQGLADYFTPSNASMSNSSGSGDILAGTSLADEGANASGAVSVTVPPDAAAKVEEQPDEDNDSSKWQAKVVEREDNALKAAEADLKIAIQQNPDLRRFQDHLVVEQTPDGMRIQIMDHDRRPMFKNGTAELYGFARDMFTAVADVLDRLPNRMVITGHTDASPSAGRDYGNWELSADRANAVRRVLAKARVSRDRFSQVVGKAATEPLFPDNPFRAENKRVSILVLREAPAFDPNFGKR